MTATQRINALVVLLGIVLVVALRPVTIDLAAGGPSVECDVASFVVGERDPIVTEACRDAFKGRAAAALIVLAGIAVLASHLVRRDEEPLAAAEPVPPAWAPGEDPSLLGGLGRAARNPSFRVVAALGLALIVILVAVSRPVSARAADGAGVRSVSCGLRQQLFGAGDATVTATCREAYAGRAFAVVLVVAALGIAVSMLVWIVRYHRGTALGAIWHRAGLPRAILVRVGGACGTLAAIAVVAAGGSSAPAAARAVGEPEWTAALGEAPLAEDITPRPTFPTLAAATATVVAPPARPSSRVTPATTTATATTTVPTTAATTSTLPPSAPLTVRDASWFAANRNPFDASSIPEGSLPVGAVGGEDDAHAFFRVTGTAPTLVLVESDGAGAQRLPEQARVRACPVTDDGWKQTSGGDLEDEPAYDARACVDVVRAGEGTWSIDLGAFDDRGGSRGFALVPADGATTFRLTLQPQPTAGQP